MEAPVIRAAVLLVLIAMAATEAQEPGTRAEQIRQQRAEMQSRPPDPDTDKIERGIEWAHRHGLLTLFSTGWKGLSPTLGGLVNGSGFAVGAQFLHVDPWGGDFVFRASARASTRAFQLYDIELGLPNAWNRRAFLDLYIRRRHYPDVAYYGPGPESRRGRRTSYRLEDTSYDVSAGVRPLQRLRLGVAGGYLQAETGPGGEDDDPPAQVPGSRIQSDFLRGGVLAHLDLRDSPYGPRAGGQYYGRFDYYDDRSGNNHSFRRLTAEVQQFVPLFNEKRVIAARAKTVLSYPGPGQQTPFYLQPSLGSADDLRGFAPFRFYDDNSFVMNAEWRWEIMSGVEGALFIDAGKVFPRPGQLNLARLEKSYGGGLRFRAPMSRAMVVRMDVAASSEGIQFWFVFNDLFAAPQVRTGRELSPPPGRLP